MMLTDLPPRFIHRVRDAAAYVHDLAQLGLELLCPCGDDHSGRLRVLEGDGNGCPDVVHMAVDCPGDACRHAADVHLACGCGWHQCRLERAA